MTPSQLPAGVESARRSHPLILAAIAAIAAALFTWLAFDVLRYGSWPYDAAIRTFAYRQSSPALNLVMRAISALGANPVLLLFLALLAAYFWRANWPRGFIGTLIVALAGSNLIMEILKREFARPRPEPFHIAKPESFSFPSGHAINSFCFYLVAVGLLNSRIQSRARRATLWTAAAVLVLAIGWSRIYLGVHYPSDVLGGYAAGGIWLVAAALGKEFHGRWRQLRQAPSRFSSRARSSRPSQ